MAKLTTIRVTIDSTNKGSSSINGAVSVFIEANDQCEKSVDKATKLAKILIEQFAWVDTKCAQSDYTEVCFWLSQTHTNIKTAREEVAEAKKLLK